MLSRQSFVWSNGKWRLGFCMLFLFAIVCSTSFTAIAAELPSELENALQRNSAAISPITVKWTQQISSSIPIREWLKKVNCPPLSVDAFLPAEIEYCWQDRMAYQYTVKKKTSLIDVMDISDPNNPRLKRNANLEDLPLVLDESERASNLQAYFSGRGRTAGVFSASNPSLMIDQIQSPRLFSPSDRVFEPDYFYRAGFVMPHRFDELGSDAESRILGLIDQGADVESIERTTLDGGEYVVVELSTTQQRMRFYLDVSVNYALRRSEELSQSGQMQMMVEMSDFVLLSPSELWLPRQCEVIHYTWHTAPELITEQPLARELYVVQSIDKRPIPVEKFSLQYTMPGTLVSDSTLPEPEGNPGGVVSYEVPADLRLLDATIRSAIDGNPIDSFGIPGRGRMPGLFIFINALALAVFVAWLTSRRSRGQSA